MCCLACVMEECTAHRSASYLYVVRALDLSRPYRCFAFLRSDCYKLAEDGTVEAAVDKVGQGRSGMANLWPHAVMCLCPNLLAHALAAVPPGEVG